jgi:hypothetical protein
MLMAGWFASQRSTRRRRWRAGGLARTIVSRGVLETTLPVARGARTVRITESDGQLRIEGGADPRLTKTVAHVFRLDEDLSGF